jgi:hypothetical protein
MSKLLMIAGVVLIVIGLLWPYLLKLPFGRLPGDLLIQKKNFTFYFPLATSIAVSIFLSLILWLISKR